jgi:hypothetical protein
MTAVIGDRVSDAPVTGARRIPALSRQRLDELIRHVRIATAQRDDVPPIGVLMRSRW